MKTIICLALKCLATMLRAHTVLLLPQVVNVMTLQGLLYLQETNMTYNFVPATDIPHSKVDVLVSDSLHIEACRRKR